MAVWIVNHEGGDIAWTSSVRIPNLISVERGNPGVTIQALGAVTRDMAESTAARQLVVFQPNVAWVDRRLAALALPAMKMMTSREPPEKYKAMMISAGSIHESDVSSPTFQSLRGLR